MGLLKPGWPRNLLVAALGTAVGIVFLVLALREISWSEVLSTARSIHLESIGVALLCYWLALLLRILRWRLLLCELAPVSFLPVAETLVVGYAVNNVFPARLGEIARAAYAKRRMGIGSARVFGSIFIERFADLIAVLFCLVAGLLAYQNAAAGARLPAFEIIALNAGAGIGVGLLAIAILRYGNIGSLPMPPKLATVVNDFVSGIATLNRRSVLLLLVLTAAVWMFETSALASVFAAVGIKLSVPQAMLMMGAASLSTLVPTAPGYLGTYQLVAVIGMAALSFSETAGIVAATAIQTFLFGSVIVVGAIIILARAGRRLLLDGEIPLSSKR